MDPTILYQWSTAAQLVSVFMIALFYAIVARAVRRPEIGWWSEAWWCNFIALALTLVYWVSTPAGAAGIVLSALYVLGKVAFALLLVQGTLALRRPGARWLSRRQLTIALVATLVVSFTLLRTLDLVGVAVQGAMALLFTWCGLVVLRQRAEIPMWLGVGFIVRGVLSLIEAAGYAMHALPPGTFGPDMTDAISSFLGIHSSIDLAAEWLLALGGVLAITHRGQLELQRTNSDLLAAQEELRRLADRDPLTGLVNRRALPEAFRSVFETGATIAFFDLDGFKRINDTQGHAEGDATLIRFANALRAAFRPTDTIARYGGDEFLVVAGAMGAPMARERVDRVREKLAAGEGRPLGFSVGVAQLEAGGNAELALREADQAMYAAKVAPAST